MFRAGGREWLAGLALREPLRRGIDSTLSPIDDFDREIDATAAEIDQPGTRQALALTAQLAAGHHGRLPPNPILIANLGS